MPDDYDPRWQLTWNPKLGLMWGPIPIGLITVLLTVGTMLLGIYSSRG